MGVPTKSVSSDDHARWLRIALAVAIVTATINGCVWAFLAFTKWNAPPPGEGYLWEAGLFVLNRFTAMITGGIAALGILLAASALCSRDTRRHAVFTLAAHLLIVVFAVAVIYWPLRKTLVNAAQQGDLQSATWSLRLGVDPNSRRRMYFHDEEVESVLTLAAARGDEQMVRLLLDYGATPDHETVSAAIASNDAPTRQLIQEATAKNQD